MSCLRIDDLLPILDILYLHYRKKPFFILPSPIFLLTLSCLSWAQVPRVKTCSAHVPVFQNLHDLFPIFAASRCGAWLEETALNSLTRCPSQTDWSGTYSTITHIDPPAHWTCSSLPAWHPASPPWHRCTPGRNCCWLGQAPSHH